MFEKLYNEILAAVLLKFFWKAYPGDLVKAESPDWISRRLDFGVEVSQALLQQDGEAQQFVEEYLGKRKEDLPQSAWERYGQAMYFYNDRFWALHFPAGEDREEGYAYRAIYRFQKKLQKLNTNYRPFLTNGLFLFLHTQRPTLQDAQQLAAQMRQVQTGCMRKFRYVFMDCKTTLYIADLDEDIVEAVEIPESARAYLEQQTEVLRHGTDWPDGADFEKLYVLCKKEQKL